MSDPDPKYVEAMAKHGRANVACLAHVHVWDAASEAQRLVDEAVAEAVRKERERIANKVPAWWGMRPRRMNYVGESLFSKHHAQWLAALTADPEEGTRDE